MLVTSYTNNLLCCHREKTVQNSPLMSSYPSPLSKLVAKVPSAKLKGVLLQSMHVWGGTGPWESGDNRSHLYPSGTMWPVMELNDCQPYGMLRVLTAGKSWSCTIKWHLHPHFSFGKPDSHIAWWHSNSYHVTILVIFPAQKIHWNCMLCLWGGILASSHMYWSLLIIYHACLYWENRDCYCLNALI